MRKKISIFLLMGLLLSFCGCKKNNDVYIGDILPDTFYKNGITKDFSFTKANGSIVYRIISNLEKDVELNKYLLSSTSITLCFGFYDFINSFSISNKGIEIIQDQYELNLELLSYYYFHIVESLQNYNSKINIIPIINYSNDSFYDSYLKDYNKEICSIAADFSCRVIDLSSINEYIKDDKIIDQGGEYIFKMIYE